MNRRDDPPAKRTHGAARQGRCRRLPALLLILCGWPLPAPAETPPDAAAATGAAPTAAASALKAEPPAAIVVWGRELAILRATYAGLSPAARAAAAEARIEETLAANPREPLRLQPVSDGETTGILLVSGTSSLLFALLEGDLPVDGGTLAQEAAAVLERLRALRDAMARQREPALLARSLAESGAAIFALGFLIWRLERHLRPRLTRRTAALSRRLAERAAGAAASPAATGLDFESIAAGALRGALRTALTIVELVLAFLGVEFVLRRFPYTQPLGDELARRLLDFAGRAAAAVVDELPNLFVVAVVAFVARAIWRIAQRWTRAVETGLIEVDWLDAETARPTRILFGIGIGTAAIVVAYPFIPGSGTDAFKGLSVLFGLMLSIGGSSVIGQVISGLVVLYSRSLRRGDIVQVGDDEGQISEIGLLATRLVNAHHEQINIPSSVMVAAVSRNSTRLAAAGGAVLRTALTIGYDAPWRQVHGLLLQAAARTPGVRTDPPPRVFQRALSDFYVEYELSLQVDRNQMRAEVRTRLHAAILDAFNAAGVQIMSPAFEGQPDRPVIVPRENWSPPGAVASADVPAPPDGAPPTT
jgi:small-conductance mechanosensitive channel